MAYIEFDKTKLINLEFMLDREIVRANRGGAFACQTIIGCNTHRQHGLFVAPQNQLDNHKHLLLSTIQETVTENNHDFNLGIQRYKDGNYYPKGHKYVRYFSTDPHPLLVYRVGGVMLQKEIIMNSKAQQLLVKYTLIEANSDVKLQIKPFLAFRNKHHLTKKNEYVNTNFKNIENGAQFQMYQVYTPLKIQFSKETQYVHNPDWYFDVEYYKDIQHGFDGLEDLFVPGSFHLEIEKGESIVMSVSIEDISTSNLVEQFDLEVNSRIPRTSFINNLRNSSQQFIQKNGDDVEILAGYPWFNRLGRDTFMSIPGLLLVNGEYKTAWQIFHTMLKEMKNGLFPAIGKNQNANYDSADTSLWFIWALQQYVLFTKENDDVWENYGEAIKSIFANYKKGINGIKVDENGLVFTYLHNKALSWMSSSINGAPVNPRYGYAVEINALWFNALGFALDMAYEFGDKDFISEWNSTFVNLRAEFKKMFWNKEKGYLCDTFFQGEKDWRVRPNMLLAASLPHSPLSSKIRHLILEKTKCELLTPRGIRTLTPNDKEYRGFYTGNALEREKAYHNGSVFPWLSAHYVEAYLNIHGVSGLSVAKKIYKDMEVLVKEQGIGTISEVFDGDPPHSSGGAMSYAVNVAEIQRMYFLIQKFEEKSKEL